MKNGLFSWHLFLHGLSDLLFSAEHPLKSSEPGPETATNHEKLLKNHHRNAPTAKNSERLRLGGVEHLKLTTFTTLPAVSLKAQRSQSESKKGPGIEASGAQNRQKIGSKKREENNKE